MAEEDLIFGKNRHMFGGIEPSNMLTFTVSQRLVNGKIAITATLPNDTMINGQLLCTVGGAVIRRKTTGYPVDEFDGDFVANITSSGIIYDSKADTSVTNYYSAFPFSTQGVYNRGYANRSKYFYKNATYLFGYDLDTTNSEPNDRVTYPTDVDNYGWTPYIDDVSGYGDWPSTPGTYFMPVPCVLKTDTSTKTTQIEFDLDPNNYSKKADGTTHSYTTTSGNINFMMRWPKIYTHREVVNGVYKFRCSDVKINDDWDCICNYDSDGNEIDNFFTAIYSVDGRGNYPTFLSTNFPETIASYENTLGIGWNTELLADRLLIQDLLVMMAKSTDCETVYGKGDYANETGNWKNGKCDKKGLFASSDNFNGTYSVGYLKVFGMENYWGNAYRLINGFLIDQGKIKVKLTHSTHDGSTVNGYNSTGEGYLIAADLADYMSTTGSYGGYISEMLNETYGRIPIKGNGSSSTYETNKFGYFRSSSVGDVNYARVGGTASNGGSSDNVGLFFISATNSMTSSLGATVYLSYKPTKGSLI